MAKSGAKDAGSEKRARGRPCKLSQAIMDWGFPLIYDYGMAKLRDEREGGRVKAKAMEEFEKNQALSDPADKVHQGCFSADKTAKQLRTVSTCRDLSFVRSLTSPQQVSEWFRNTVQRSWDSGAFGEYRRTRDGGGGSTANRSSATTPSTRARSATELYAAEHAEAVQQRRRELRETQNDSDSDSDDDGGGGGARLKFYHEAVTQLFNDLDEDDKEIYKERAAESRKMSKEARTSEAAIAAYALLFMHASMIHMTTLQKPSQASKGTSKASQSFPDWQIWLGDGDSPARVLR